MARRAKKHSATYRHSHKLRNRARDKWNEVREVYGKLCFYCKSQEADTVDHYVPLAHGGDSDITNLRPSCQECNIKKGNSLPEIFLES
jgi:5-methylcytosine-specific restriction endonuclease McrA